MGSEDVYKRQDEAPSEDWRLYVDANGNGDLTDDGKAAEWKKRMDLSLIHI